jgi:hypothetical protein
MGKTGHSPDPSDFPEPDLDKITNATGPNPCGFGPMYSVRWSGWSELLGNLEVKEATHDVVS